MRKEKNLICKILNYLNKDNLLIQPKGESRIPNFIYLEILYHPVENLQLFRTKLWESLWHYKSESTAFGSYEKKNPFFVKTN